MDDQLNYAPCGFITLDEDGNLNSVNETLLILLDYRGEKLSGKHINEILSVPARLFFQLYFCPLIKKEEKVEEMYLSLTTSKGEELPVLINALRRNRNNASVIDCVLIPMRKRDEYENELIQAKKMAEIALLEKDKAVIEMEDLLQKIEEQRQELIALNRENQLYKENMEKELQLAKNIQETSLTEPISNEELQIDAYYKASSELSGDMYGFYQISRTQYGIILLDVMGHGISSSMITMSLQSLFQRLISQGVTGERIMKELDAHLHQLFRNNADAWHYCTAIYLFIDTETQTIEYVNAGHPPALLQAPDGIQYELISTTPPLGAFEGLTFAKNSVEYSSGGRLLLYTDGVTDPLDVQHLPDLLMKHPSASLKELKGSILQSLEATESSYTENDDKCFILVDLK
ncbi:SpoIIE family protein phosphatase [Evansella clarkii]|uniref:SpoIIE family protein phosphatase n=1 Tax=Evansella clarkii TaxID=79879 RepID=UPI000B43D2DD|nr:SpoIIE family protein phosphatase [Evansella clarkii]